MRRTVPFIRTRKPHEINSDSCLSVLIKMKSTVLVPLLLAFCCTNTVCLAQSLAHVGSIDLPGEILYVVVNRDNGDIYLAVTAPEQSASKVYRINENLRVNSTSDVPAIVRFMIIDYVRKSLIICGQNSCFRYELGTLRKTENVKRCVFSNYRTACTPTGSDVVAFFAGPNYDILFAATTPQQQNCEIPRVSTRSTADANFLRLLSGSETRDEGSALFLSKFSRSFPGAPYISDSNVYGFSHNGFSYFIGTLGLDNSETESRIFRVCQSDTTYSSYMEVPLICRRTLQVSRKKRIVRQVGDVLYRRSVTWAQLTTATRSLSALGYQEGEDVLYYVMSRGVLCVTSMLEVEDAFLRNIEKCLDGLTMNAAAPDTTNNATSVNCPRNNQNKPEDVVCDITEGLGKFSGTVPIVGQAIMDVGITAEASVVNTGTKSAFVYSNGYGFIQSNFITAVPIYSDYEDAALFECASPTSQFRLHPDNFHVFTFETRKGDFIQQEYPVSTTTVTKAVLANCSVYSYECSSCLSNVFCGWCMERNSCTLESECPNGEWLEADANSFYRETPNPGCLYIDQVGAHTVTFSPHSGLNVGITLLRVNITVEKRLADTFQELPQIYIGDNLLCNGAYFEYFEDEYFDGYTRMPSNYTLQCSVGAPEGPYEAPVAVKLMGFVGDYPSFMWLNSTEKFRFVVPTFRDFAPLKGPQAGGTLLELYGSNLLAGNNRQIIIDGNFCELKLDFSTDEQLVCVTDMVPEPIQAYVQINFNDGFSLTSLRRYTYTENPFIEMIYPLRTFVGGGELQNVVGTHLDSIARPLFVVQVFVNDSYVDEFHSECTVHNSTFMTCPSPEIITSGFLNNSISKRSINDDVSDEECNVITRTPSGELIEFRIGLVLDGVQEWLPSVIDQHLDAKYTTITVARDPIFHLFSGSGNIMSFSPSINNYLVIEGERLDCGATVNDITVEVGVAYCTPVVSLYRTQLTCLAPSKQPPARSDYTEDHGFPHVLVRVGLASSRYLVGYIDYAETGSAVEAWVIAIAVCVIILVVLAVAVVAFFVVRRLRRDDGIGGQRQKSRENEYQSTQPNTQPAYMTVTFEDGKTYAHLQKGKLTLMEQLDEGTRLQIQDVLIESSRLQLDSNKILGKGQFGRVLLGDLLNKNGGGSMQVAVKSLKKNTDIDDVQKFLEEGLMMKDFKHENVLSLVGVCIDEDDCPMIVLPYMKHGDLKSFVEKPERELTVGKLITYSLHVARGMEYLSTLKFVHRDLAARNCMVDESETIKVSDFGLSRDIYEREYYASEDKKAKLPIRWMPLESIKNSIFNVKTDVWSYGVLVWELLTRGELPYASVDNWDIPSYLERGRRLSQPAFAPDNLYEVLLKCWNKNPEERPDFGTICQELQGILERGEKAMADSDNYYLQPVASPLYISPIA